jgi:hypothetical protein
LTASPWLRRGCTMVPGLPGARLARTCGLVIASPPRGAPSSRRFLPGGRPCPWPLTLSVALPRSGLWDLTPTERDRTEEEPGSPPPAASSKGACFLDPERLPSSGLPALPACAIHRRAPPPISATNSIHEHSSRSSRTRSRDARRSGGPFGQRNQWRVNPCGRHANRALIGQGQIGFRRTGPRAIATTGEGRIAGRALPRSVSLEHLLSRARGDADGRGQHHRTLARPLRAHQGPPLAFPRDGESNPLRPRCLPF